MGTSRRGGAVFNCPSAWRISQSLIASGRKQKNIQTHFHQCFFFFLLPSCYSLSVASTSGLFAPLSLSISYPHSLFPFPSLSLSAFFCSHAAFFGWVWEDACLCFMCLHKFTTIVYIVMYVFAETQSQSSKACHLRSGSFCQWVFCCITQAHIPSLTQSRKKQDKLQVPPRVVFNSAFHTHSIPASSSK